MCVFVRSRGGSVCEELPFRFSFFAKERRRRGCCEVTDACILPRSWGIWEQGANERNQVLFDEVALLQVCACFRVGRWVWRLLVFPRPHFCGCQRAIRNNNTGQFYSRGCKIGDDASSTTTTWVDRNESYIGHHQHPFRPAAVSAYISARNTLALPVYAIT